MHGYPDFASLKEMPVYDQTIFTEATTDIESYAIFTNNTTNIIKVFMLTTVNLNAALVYLRLFVKKSGGTIDFYIDSHPNFLLSECIYNAFPIYLFPGDAIWTRHLAISGTTSLFHSYGYTEHKA